MSLVTLATEENWQAFDDAWTEQMAAEAPLDDLLDALEVVGRKRRMSRCLPKVREHAELLAAADRHGEAAELLGAALRGGGAVGEIAEPLWQNARAAWGSEEWWEAYCETSGFAPSAPDLRKAWTYLHDMKSYREGLVVFHAAGWGAGEVLEVDPSVQEVRVAFQSGRKDRFPLRTAVEIFEVLPENDLRALALRDPKGVKKRLKDEPLEILRALLVRFGGKATNITLRNAMMQIGVTGNTWSSWWRKTRLLAENSEWFRVSGTATRAEITLLHRAVDPVEGLQRQLRNAPTLKEALTRVRDLLGGTKLEDAVREAALELLDELSRDASQDPQYRLATWMLLREHRKETPPALTAILEEARRAEVPTDPSVPPEFWSLLQSIPGAREQERALELLPEVFGEGWIGEAVEHLPHAPPGMAPALIARLLEAGHGDALAAHYARLLARPLRAPFVLIALAHLAENGVIQGELPTPGQRAQALIELGVNLQAGRRGSPITARAQERLTALLCDGEEPLLRRLLEGADLETLASLRAMLQRGIDDRIDVMVTDIALEHGPELFATEARPFWEEDTIWTTREALERRRRELREIREEKLPENAETLARAAAYGDLSENAEWEQAVEQQRQLTEQAKSMELELARVSLLENAPIPEDTVCPGTYVTYRDEHGEHELALLGPWDTDRDDAVSYKAPLALGMLGMHPGERTTIQLPSGPLGVEIVAVRPTDA